jgi:mono/diheme cytochrome c family protein
MKMRLDAFLTRIEMLKLAVLLLVTLLCMACAKTIQQFIPSQVAQGHDLYTQNCQGCHGDAATGAGAQPGTPLNSAAGHTWHHSDAQLTDIILGRIATPGRTMPSYAGQLTEQDIQAILSYIKSNWPEDLRRHQAEIK